VRVLQNLIISSFLSLWERIEVRVFGVFKQSLRAFVGKSIFACGKV
jgi:hypothetical protein